MKNIWGWVKKIIGYIIIGAMLILGLAAGIIFASYIIVYVLGVLIGVVLLIGLLYLILKLIGY
jgi:hypothetical protein